MPGSRGRGGGDGPDPAGRSEAARLLDQVAEEMTASGLVEGIDFIIGGRDPGGLPASEIVGMGFRDGRFQAFYRRSARIEMLAESADFDEVRAVFERDVVWFSLSARARAGSAVGIDQVGVVAHA